jgi:uncharacterized membrane protein YkvA (DUF1232 family)
MPRILDRAKSWAKTLERDVITLWIAARDPRTPLSPKVLAAAIAAYALSPIDLIPDFVPVLGQIDDLIIVPLGIWLTVSLIPRHLLFEFRETAELRLERPSSRTGVLVILGIWALCALAFAWLVWTFLHQ